MMMIVTMMMAVEVLLVLVLLMTTMLVIIGNCCWREHSPCGRAHLQIVAECPTYPWSPAWQLENKVGRGAFPEPRS